MQRRPSKILLIVGAILLWNWPAFSRADDIGIQTLLDSKGRIVFTNAVDAASAAIPQKPAIPQSAARRGEKVMPPAILLLVQSISNTHGVDPELVAAMMKVESNYDRLARSSKGALGLMQLIPATGRRYGVQDFFDPRQNIEGGVRYLKFLLDKFEGNVDLSLAAYNAGENLVERLGRVPPIAETREYVRRIRSTYKKALAPLALFGNTGQIGPQPAANPIFRSVDERGIGHFSNIGPAD